MDRVAVLRSFPLLRGASEERLGQLAQLASWKTFEEGATLWRAGDVGRDVLLVRSGLVQIVRRLSSGEDATLALFGPREHVGLVAVMEGDPYPADAVVVSEALEAVLVPAGEFRKSVEQEPVMLRSATSGVVQRARSLRTKIEILTAGEVDRRLATLLLHLADRFGDEGEDGSLIVPLALTRRMLARLVGSREETVSRILSQWNREQVAATVDRSFVLRNVQFLQDTAKGG